MSVLTQWVDRVRDGMSGKGTGLRPNYPPVAVEIDADGIVLVRLRRRRGRGRPQLEAHQARPMPDSARGASIFRPALGSTDDLAARVGELFAATATKPGRVSLVLPDNLAKISLIHLPERPGSMRQLDEIVRFKLRRAVPFKLDDAVLSYQVLPGSAGAVDVLVVLLRRVVVEQYESVLSRAGARVGLVDLCTPNLLNLARERVAELGGDGGDVALFNFARGYFSLVIVRRGRLIFYRCKSFARTAEGEDVGQDANVMRELHNSLAYYQEKLDGERLSAAVVRAVDPPLESIGERLHELGIEVIEPLDPTPRLGMAEGLRLEPEVGQRIAPAVGAACGRA